MRRIADDEIPTLVARNVIEAIGTVNGHPVAEIVLANGSLDTFDRRRIDVGKAKGVAQTSREDMEADEAGTGTPFVNPAGLADALIEKWDVILAECSPPAVEFRLVENLDIAALDEVVTHGRLAAVLGETAPASNIPKSWEGDSTNQPQPCSIALRKLSGRMSVQTSSI